MPSVRVKKGYSTLTDPDRPADPSTSRPRSRSLAQIFAPTVPPDDGTTADSPEKTGYARPRSQTVSASARPISHTLPRQPSRILQHIMDNNRASHHSGHYTRQRENSLLSEDAARYSSGHSHRISEVRSLQGLQEDIIIVGGRERRESRVGSALSMHSDQAFDPYEDHHADGVVEHLDVIDPQIATVSTLTNAANAIVIPPLSFYSRKPVIVLSQAPPRQVDAEKSDQAHYEDALDRHVEDVLSKRDQFRRVMRGVWSFMKTPMGVIVTIYGFLVVFWGAGIVFFLAKFINFHNANTQGFWVEVCQQVETALFTATSIGLIPFRIVDTYRISKIWRYQKKTIKLRAKAGLPELYDLNDLPDPVYDPNYVHVLTDEEQSDLHYQQHQFMQSQTWYRPHGTQTHRAFPIGIALLICTLNDLNSFFQCILSACMWSMNRFERPAWTTATTLPAAFLSGIAAAVYIWWGGKKTKRHEQVEERLRAALASEMPPKDSPTADSPHCEAQGVSSDGKPLSGEETTSRLPVAQCSEMYTETMSTSDRNGEPCSRSASVGSVDIVDHMTVPPADAVHDSASEDVNENPQQVTYR